LNQPQPHFFDESYSHFYFLEYRLNAHGLKDLGALKKALLDISEHSSQSPALIAFGEAGWRTFQPAWRPDGLMGFRPLNGEEGHRAPSTQADLFFWIRGHNISSVLDEAMMIHHKIEHFAVLSLQERGFRYHEDLDLIGFEDGTANPKTNELKAAAALIPEGQAGAGGSFVLSQKWVHDLAKWQKIPVHCQEQVVGRTKFENEELSGEAMPIDSHVSRTDLTVKGVPMKVYRRSAPYGTVTEKGLYYLAFACEMLRFTSQLNSMYGLTEDKEIDQLLNYAKAVSGGYWFAPSQQDLLQVLSK